MLEDVETPCRSIVVIDDDPDELLLLRRMLMKAGVADAISAFENPVAALEYLDGLARSSDPRHGSRIVVLSDLKMPGLDGFAVLQRIRAREFSAQVCVIIVSGCALESDVERARALGADGYLEKMPSPELLAACIDRPSFAATGSRSQLFESWEATQPKVAAR